MRGSPCVIWGPAHRGPGAPDPHAEEGRTLEGRVPSLLPQGVQKSSLCLQGACCKLSPGQRLAKLSSFFATCMHLVRFTFSLQSSSPCTRIAPPPSCNPQPQPLQVLLRSVFSASGVLPPGIALPLQAQEALPGWRKTPCTKGGKANTSVCHCSVGFIMNVVSENVYGPGFLAGMGRMLTAQHPYPGGERMVACVLRKSTGDGGHLVAQSAG